MKELIARLEKKEPCFITLLVSMEPDNAKYQPYQCYGEPETIKVIKEKGVIRFTNKPVIPRFEKEFDAKITFDGPEIYFSADCYENPEERFKLSEIFKEEKDTYGLEGFDGRDDIQIFFSFSGKK